MKLIQKIIASFVLGLMLFLVDLSYSQTNTNKSGTAKTYSSTQTKKQTNNVKGTKYISGQTYKTTGEPKVKRSESAKKEFLKSKGYTKIPKGYQIDHKIPLSQGGKDVPSNMQLLSVSEHKAKTARERKEISSTHNSSHKKNNKSSGSSYKSQTHSTTHKSYSSGSHSHTHSSSGSRKK